VRDDASGAGAVTAREVWQMDGEGRVSGAVEPFGGQDEIVALEVESCQGPMPCFFGAYSLSRRQGGMDPG